MFFSRGSRVLENVSLGRETDLAKISARDSLKKQKNQGFSKKRNSSKNQKIIHIRKKITVHWWNLLQGAVSLNLLAREPGLNPRTA